MSGKTSGLICGSWTPPDGKKPLRNPNQLVQWTMAVVPQPDGSLEMCFCFRFFNITREPNSSTQTQREYCDHEETPTKAEVEWKLGKLSGQIFTQYSVPRVSKCISIIRWTARNQKICQFFLKKDGNSFIFALSIFTFKGTWHLVSDDQFTDQWKWQI